MSFHWKDLKSHLPHVRFLTVHYAYFIGVTLVTSAIFWGSSTPAHSVRYIDSLFLTVSAMTLAGLNTVNLSTLNTFQQILLFFLIMAGSTIWVSIGVIAVRKSFFEKKFKEIVQKETLRRKRLRKSTGFARRLTWSRSISRQPTIPEDPNLHIHRRRPSIISLRPIGSRNKSQGQISTDSADDRPSDQQAENIHPISRHDSGSVVSDERFPDRRFSEDPNDTENTDVHIAFTNDVRDGRGDRRSPMRRRMRPPYVNVQSMAAAQNGLEEGHDQDSDGEDDSHRNFLRKISRNSSFHHLSERERQRLGGAEYRAVSLLSVIVPLYFLLWQLLGGLGVGAYVARNKAALARANGMNPWWVGFFFAISAFNNSGMSILDANMVPFQRSTYMLITMGLLILAGNTWILPPGEYFHYLRETLTFLLEHPRRCYTTLFPSAHTWWLFLSVIVLNGIDWVAYEVLNYDNPAVDAIPVGPRILDGLFQALCVRSGGFYITNISALQIGTQVLYVIMMYISVYPVVITMRHSNVYEERSLGIYADDPTVTEDRETSSSNSSLAPRSPSPGRMYFIRHQLRAQIAYDLWWIALAVLVICIVEAGNFTRDPVTYSAFNIIFETVSAYGSVGISTGLPTELYSFSGGWHTLSKLVLCAVMIRGRHRALPVAIDKAIMLPSDKLAKAEEEDALIRMERTMSRTR
ncbi:Low-affinity potassium transport protein [Penicillium maclennaniae]|uniref:Low-affinity potassium transport protein n=1 Tax=Penicillium maclennaniae TaxID=1343394 RepID=UPI00253FF964|nr:Low-affinity potassium transport protein [Penicillium maclennaniae]KAJ5684619.1 Low-affinity potassium transport protein [Penicillium maclennaniae]